MNIVSHKQVRLELEKFKQNLPQSLLLNGMPGVGLATIAAWLGEKHGFIRTLKPHLLTKTSSIVQISITDVRDLYESTRTKSKGLQIIIIDNADMMTIPAQQSFLKLLEEPPENIRFILTSHQPERLIPTIQSRVSRVYIPPLDTKESDDFLNSLPSKLNPISRQKIQFIAAGLPAEMVRLVKDKDYFDAASLRMTTAKQLLSAPLTDRMTTALKNSVNRQEALALIDSMLLLTWRAPGKETILRSKQLLEARERISGGGNVKLQLFVAIL